MTSGAPAGSALSGAGQAVVAESRRPRLPWRDRVAIFAALGGVTLLSWVYLFYMALGTECVPVQDGASNVEVICGLGFVAMDERTLTSAAELPTWTAGYFALMLVMWVVMMIGMMVPSATPMAMLYASIARKARRQNQPIAGTYLFVIGYLLMWVLFSVAATFTQWGLDAAGLLSPMMSLNSPVIGAGVLIAVGVYQLLPAKRACLEHCCMPGHFISRHWRDGRLGAVHMGMHHGAYCLGCCWALMVLLFLGGVMSLLWIALITVFVLLEKVVPLGPKGGRWIGGAMIVAGIALLVI